VSTMKEKRTFLQTLPT